MHTNFFCIQGCAIKAVWRLLFYGMFTLHIGCLPTVPLGIFIDSYKEWFWGLLSGEEVDMQVGSAGSFILLVCWRPSEYQLGLTSWRFPFWPTVTQNPTEKGASGKCHPCFSQVDNRIIQDGAQQASGMVPVDGLCVYMHACAQICMCVCMCICAHMCFRFPAGTCSGMSEVGR